MDTRYVFADAAKFLAEYEQAERMFRGIDDDHCLELKNKAAHKYNAAISKLEPLPIVTVRPAKKEDVQLVTRVVNAVTIAEDHSKEN